MIRDLAIVKSHIDADPFGAELSGLRALYFGACCIHKSAETGKGRELARRHLAKIRDAVFNIADATDTLRRVYFAAHAALKKSRP